MTTDTVAYADTVATNLVDRLHNDEATWVDEDAGVRWRVRLVPDEGTTINDFDCYGKASKYALDYWRDGQKERPADFTGAARKIEIDRGYWVWWEPYREGHKVYDSPEDVRQVTDLLRRGFMVVSISHQTKCQGCDEWGQEIAQSLGGIDSIKDADLNCVIQDIVHEIMFEVNERSIG